MKQQELNKYFATKWHSNIDQYIHSGWALVDKIQSNELVLDVGCGRNEFRGRIPNLIGVDPAFAEADYQVSIEEFQSTELFDVAFCLGSINFGDEDIILNQIYHVVKLLKSTARIYWRCNPGVADHSNEACKNINFFPWSLDKHVRYSEHFGFRLTTCRWDNNNRIYAEWHR
jgi:hypothetical protein